MRFSTVLVGTLASATFACAVPTPDPSADSTSSTSSAATAVVVVERTLGPGDAVRGDAVVARFVRVRQGIVDDPALRVAGVAEDVPAPGACTVPADTLPAIQGRAVELLDVGQVTLHSVPADSAANVDRLAGRARSTVLLPRSMPDPAGVVSGMFYASRSADAFVAGSRVGLRSNGGPDLEGFAITVNTPRDLTEVRVSPAAAGLDVSWAAGDDARDLVYVDVQSPAARVVLRCTSLDSGHLLVPVGNVDDGLIAVHRLHKESFRAKGIEPGEVRFDTAKVIGFRR